MFTSCCSQVDLSRSDPNLEALGSCASDMPSQRDGQPRPLRYFFRLLFIRRVAITLPVMVSALFSRLSLLGTAISTAPAPSSNLRTNVGNVPNANTTSNTNTSLFTFHDLRHHYQNLATSALDPMAVSGNKIN